MKGGKGKNVTPLLTLCHITKLPCRLIAPWRGKSLPLPLIPQQGLYSAWEPHSWEAPNFNCVPGIPTPARSWGGWGGGLWQHPRPLPGQAWGLPWLSEARGGQFPSLRGTEQGCGWQAHPYPQALIYLEIQGGHHIWHHGQVLCPGTDAVHQDEVRGG